MEVSIACIEHVNFNDNMTGTFRGTNETFVSECPRKVSKVGVERVRFHHNLMIPIQTGEDTRCAH